MNKCIIFLGFCFLLLFPLHIEAKSYTVKDIPNTHLSSNLNYVSNPDGIISEGHVAQINYHLKMLEDSLGIEVAVVAVESIGDNDARMFATELFKHWGIGKKGEDNGLLIQLVTELSQRSVVFETGYGIEGTLPDAICYRLQQQYMIPDMKEGDYSTGMLKGVAAVRSYLMASDYEREAMSGVAFRNERQNVANEKGVFSYLLNNFFGLFEFFPFFVILVFVVLNYFIKRRKRKCPKCGKKAFSYTKKAVIQQATYSRGGVVEEYYFCKNCGYTETKRHNTSRLRSSGGASFGGGGSRSSGGGSWGGGRSGGGGSISRF